MVLPLLLVTVIFHCHGCEVPVPAGFALVRTNANSFSGFVRDSVKGKLGVLQGDGVFGPIKGFKATLVGFLAEHFSVVVFEAVEREVLVI